MTDPAANEARARVTIANRLGLHARAAAKLVQLAARFEADIVLAGSEREANAKSIMSVMMLAASQGTELEVLARGRDAQRAVEAVTALIEDRFGEPE